MHTDSRKVSRHNRPINASGNATQPKADSTFYHLLAAAVIGKEGSYKYKGKQYTGTIVGLTTTGEALVDIVRPHHETRQYTINLKDLKPVIVGSSKSLVKTRH